LIFTGIHGGIYQEIELIVKINSWTPMQADTRYIDVLLDMWGGDREQNLASLETMNRQKLQHM
jgi:hypothetical protein